MPLWEYLRWRAYHELHILPDMYLASALIACTTANTVSKRQHRTSEFYIRGSAVLDAEDSVAALKAAIGSQFVVHDARKT
jgi:hypothetical protein